MELLRTLRLASVVLPIVLGTGLTASALPRKHAPPPGVTTIKECPVEGSGGDPFLNRAKDRTDKAQDANPEKLTVQRIIDLDEEELPDAWHRNGPRDALADLGEGTAVVVTGYVIHAEVTGTPEACNCYLPGPADNDLHLNLVESKKDTRADSVVVEMTPRFRAAGWTPSALRALAHKKKYVRVTGWLLLDSQHLGNAAGRATAWEVHPITKFEVCQGSQASCDQGKNWKDLAGPQG